jgi:regulator of protease activity HflC (stomatin/prohibitin superfamily)
MWVSTGILLGFVAWFILRYIVTSFYVVNQNERAVKTSFGRAQRRGHATTWIRRWLQPCSLTNTNGTVGRWYA